MQLPEDIIRHINSFIKPKLKTKREWIDFYLEKVTLRYKVGMRFKIGYHIHTITIIEPTHMITKYSGGSVFWPSVDIFHYKNLEHRQDFPWTSLLSSNSSKKKIYITNALNYIKQEQAIVRKYSLTKKNKYHQLLWRDYNNYKEWGSIVAGK